MTRRHDDTSPGERDWAADILRAAGEFFYLSIERPGQAAYFRELATRLEMIGLQLRGPHASQGMTISPQIYAVVDGADPAG
jgi:hypothetical protein